ncbi:MAG TPA: hypothetical protein VF875_15380 [Anaeromyxobacter sp.]
MTLEVPEHVPHRVPDLGRRPEDVRVVAVGEHRAGAPHHAIQAASDPDGERAHAARERPRPVRLDDEVEVVAQDREVRDPESPIAARPAYCRVDHPERPLAPQVPDMRRHPHRHVHRLVGPDLLACGVRRALPIAGWLPPRTYSCAAPGAELELLLAQRGSLRAHDPHTVTRF